MKTNSFSAIRTLLLVFFVVALIMPISVMLFTIATTDIAAVIFTQKFGTALANSLTSASVSTIISVLFAACLAFALVKSQIKFKSVFAVLFTLPMLIPSISHGMGIVILFGQNGLLTNLFNMQNTIYGLTGIVVGSVFYSFPIAFLMFYDVLNYEDCQAYEAADVLGVPKLNQFLSITIPYLTKSLISIIFATFTLIVTDYGVPLMIGGKFMTLPVLMYQEVIGLLDFGKGSVIGIFLLIPAILAFVIDKFVKNNAYNGFVSNRIIPKKHVIRDVLAYVFCFAATVLAILPIFAFTAITIVKKYPIDLSMSLSNVFKTLDMGASQYWFNSIIIGVLVGIVGVFATYFTAYLTSRTKGKLANSLHLMSIISLTVPGIVLGLSYAMFFKSSFLYGTIAILILVNIIHFFSSPYLMAYNSFNKFNQNLESVGETLGVSKIYILRDVFVPQMKETIIEMFSYFFVNSMITISAVSFLATVNNKPLSLMITQFEAQAFLEGAAFVSLLILATNVAVKATVYCVKRYYLVKEHL